MKKSVTSNYIYNLLFQILTLVFPIIITPYLSRTLGVERIGVFSYTFSIITYFILISSLSINLYGQREIGYLQDDKDNRSKLFFELIDVRIITTLVGLVTYLFFVIIVHEYKQLYWLWIIELVASLFDISWYFRGTEQFKKIILRNLIIKVLSCISIFIFVKTENDLNTYILIYGLTTFIGNISLWFYLPTNINFKYSLVNNFSKIKVHLKSLFILFIPQIATTVYTMLDKLMIGVIVHDKSEVGYYEQSQKIIYFLLTILTSLGTVLMPRISFYFSQNKIDKIKESIIKSYNFVFMIGIPLMCGAILISKYFIPIYLGNGYEKSILLMQILSPIILIVGLSNVSGIQILIPLKKQKQYNISIISGALINFILNIFFIKFFTSLGAAIATVIAEFIILTIQHFFVKNIIDLKSIFKGAYKYLIVSIFMFITCCLVEKFIKFSNVIMLIIIPLIGTSIYFILLLIFKDNYIMTFLKKLCHRN